MTPSSVLTGWSFVCGSDGTVPLSNADDATLIERFLRADDESAFEILVRRYQEKVFGLAASILGRGDESEVEDATQEVFIIVLRKLKSFRGESAFATWLYRVARNQIVDYRRRACRRALRSSESILWAIPDSGSFTDPQEAVTVAGRQARLMNHVDRLHEPQRVVVYLHYWQERSIAEIAELLGIPPSTVKSHLFRARQGLAKALREDERDE